MLSGRLCIRVECAGKATVSAQIRQVLNQTTDFKSSVQSRGEKIINRGAIPTLGFSMLALPVFGIPCAVSVLFASFGYHMQLAGPLGVLNFLNITSQNGILVKDGRALAQLSKVDTVVFDKTGTLTEEIPTVGQIHTNGMLDVDQLLTFAAAAEDKQDHPIALKTANVNISMRGASSIATDTAEIILMDASLNKLLPLFKLAHDLDRNLTKSTIMTIVPGIICVGGVFFLHFGLVTAMMLYGAGLVTSVANAMWPHFKHQQTLTQTLNSDRDAQT